MTTTPETRALKRVARSVDDDTFRQAVKAHRAELHAHCYRMLGSVHDAEDALETPFYEPGAGCQGSMGAARCRTWLYRIATNACSRRPEPASPPTVLPIDYGPPMAAKAPEFGEPLVESVWVEPYPDEALGLPDGYASPDARYEQREAVELAFVAALQHLPPGQRAVLIMREVLGFLAKEVSDSISISVGRVGEQCAPTRTQVARRAPSRPESAEDASRARRRKSQGGCVRCLRRCVDEARRRCVAGVAGQGRRLVHAAVVSLVAQPRLNRLLRRGRPRLVPAHSRLRTRANGQPALAYYALDAGTGR